MPAENKKTYLVRSPLRHNGHRYGPTGTVELTGAEAARLIELQVVAECEDEAGDRQSLILEAIDRLDLEDKGHWTRDGRPQVAALEAATGLTDISAAERDAIFGEYNSNDE